MSWDSPNSFAKTEWFKFENGKEHHVFLLMDQPVTIFMHQVAGIDGKRKYQTFPCDFYDEDLKVGKSVSGLDDAEDPLWDDLKEKDRYRKVDGEEQRVDFPVKAQDFIWVWNCATKQKELLRFGPMLKQDLVKIQKVLGDLSNVKLSIKKYGSGQFGTKYEAVSFGAMELDQEVVDAKESIDFDDLKRLALWFDQTKLDHVKAGTVPEEK